MLSVEVYLLIEWNLPYHELLWNLALIEVSNCFLNTVELHQPHRKTSATFEFTLMKHSIGFQRILRTNSIIECFSFICAQFEGRIESHRKAER